MPSPRDAAWYRPVRASGASFGIYLLLPVLSFVFIRRLQRRDDHRYLAAHGS